jgi:ribose transport system permease protein
MKRLPSETGMLLVLATLAALFSVLTLREQPVDGATALAQLANAASPDQTVLIAMRDTPAEISMARALAERWRSAGVQIAAVVNGDPAAVRAQFKQLPGRPPDLIACSPASARWLVIEELAKHFPEPGTPRVVQPQNQRWPDFLKADNLLNIANQISVIAILSVGMTLVILTGGIDLSVGSLLALAAVVSSWLVREVFGGIDAGSTGMFLAGLAAVLVCGAVGACNGLMVTRFSIPPFIATLAVMLVASGLAFLIAEGQSIYQLPESFIWLGRGTSLFGLPNAVLLTTGLFLLAHLLLAHTCLGRHLYAVGGNREAALVSGVPVDRMLRFAYLASGLLAGLGGVVMASQLKSGSPTYGGMYELYVIAAVVVGGASLSGGRGTMAGTLIGALIIAVIQNGMNLINVESYTQKVVLGLVILGAVLADRRGVFRAGNARRPPLS